MSELPVGRELDALVAVRVMKLPAEKRWVDWDRGDDATVFVYPAGGRVEEHGVLVDHHRIYDGPVHVSYDPVSGIQCISPGIVRRQTVYIYTDDDGQEHFIQVDRREQEWVIVNQEWNVYGTPVPRYSEDIAAAWQVVEKLRDMWAAAADSVPTGEYFEAPFDAGAFFDILHRVADRGWPYALLWITPEAICRAALRALEGKR